MPRLRELLWRHEPRVNASIDLLMGPTDAPGELTVDQLEVAWQIERDRLLSEYRGPPGTRPWAWWWFDLGEQQPHDWAAEAVRLAELGELRDDELAALRERANEAKLRVGTPRERVSGGSLRYGGCAVVSVDRRAVELFEAVRTAAGGRAS
jgi:hypothetical protein